MNINDKVIEVFLLISFFSILPPILIMFTSFTRIVVVLSFLRQAIGGQQPTGRLAKAPNRPCTQGDLLGQRRRFRRRVLAAERGGELIDRKVSQTSGQGGQGLPAGVGCEVASSGHVHSPSVADASHWRFSTAWR